MPQLVQCPVAHCRLLILILPCLCPTIHSCILGITVYTRLTCRGRRAGGTIHTVADQDTPDTGPVDRGSAATPSEQVTAIMRGRISSGAYPPGSRMPSTATLSQEFGIAPRTVRKALAPLAAEGLIETRPGWGTFVTLNAP